MFFLLSGFVSLAPFSVPYVCNRIDFFSISIFRLNPVCDMGEGIQEGTLKNFLKTSFKS